MVKTTPLPLAIVLDHLALRAGWRIRVLRSWLVPRRRRRRQRGVIARDMDMDLDLDLLVVAVVITITAVVVVVVDFAVVVIRIGLGSGDEEAEVEVEVAVGHWRLLHPRTPLLLSARLYLTRRLPRRFSLHRAET